ncbi:uncharacterized protein LOC144094528 isoform X2 [Amblyomma americanum]
MNVASSSERTENVPAILCSLSPIEEEKETQGDSGLVVSPVRLEVLAELHSPDFWAQLAYDLVDRQAWRVGAFDESCARGLEDYSDDVRHYPVLARRGACLKLRANPARWSRLALAALREAAADEPGPATATLSHSGVLAAFRDFATHIHYFQVTRGIMESAGLAVPVTANASSCVHDVDKVDPVMLAGYSERWQDLRDTALWRTCLESHFAINTHHQQNELWHSEDGEAKERECSRALPELLCDKVSRKLQKELGGVVSRNMWSTEQQYYLGMPDMWFERATKMAAALAEEPCSQRWRESTA